jgi:hypothetical protein
MQSSNSPHSVLPEAIGSQQMKVSKMSVSPIVSKNGRSQLGADYKPTRFSVICGRGKDSYEHVGNHHFRELASMFVARYARASSKADKSEIVSEMVGIIHQADGIFCKFDKGAWCKVGDHYAREKAGALLRDMVHNQQSPSSPVKAKQVKKAKKSKAKAARPRIQKQTKTQNQQYGQQLVNSISDHSRHDSTPMTQAQYRQLLVEYDTTGHSEASTPTQQCGEQHAQLIPSGTAAVSHSDDSSVSTLSYWGEDPQGLEENWLEDEEDFFDIFGAECCIVGVPSSLCNGAPCYY